MTRRKRNLLALLAGMVVLNLWLQGLRAAASAGVESPPVVQVLRVWRTEGLIPGAPRDWLGQAVALVEAANAAAASSGLGSAVASAPAALAERVNSYVQVSLNQLLVAIAVLGVLCAGTAAYLLEHALLERIRASSRELSRDAGARDVLRFP